MDKENVLEITTGSLEEFEQETLEDLKRIEEGGRGTPKIMFADPEMFREVLTEKRQELMQEVLENPPKSMRELAENLERGLREVHDDVHLLESYGIVELEEEKGRKKPRIPYDRVRIEIDLPVLKSEKEAAAVSQ